MESTKKYTLLGLLFFIILLPFHILAEDDGTYKFLCSTPKWKVYVNYNRLKINRDKKCGIIYTIPVIIDYTVIQEDGTKQFHTKFEYTKDWKYCRFNGYWYEDINRMALSWNHDFIGEWLLVENGTTADDIRIRMKKFF